MKPVQELRGSKFEWDERPRVLTRGNTAFVSATEVIFRVVLPDGRKTEWHPDLDGLAFECMNLIGRAVGRNDLRLLQREAFLNDEG